MQNKYSLINASCFLCLKALFLIHYNKIQMSFYLHRILLLIIQVHYLQSSKYHKWFFLPSFFFRLILPILWLSKFLSILLNLTLILNLRCLLILEYLFLGILIILGNYIFQFKLMSLFLLLFFTLKLYYHLQQWYLNVQKQLLHTFY